MARRPRRVNLGSDTDLVALIEQLQTDGIPRMLERDGEDVAVILNVEDYAALAAEPKSKRNKERLLELAGAWSDLDGRALKDSIYRWRHESPPSPPVRL